MTEEEITIAKSIIYGYYECKTMKQNLQHLIYCECEKHAFCTGCKYYKLSTCNVDKMTEHEILIAETMTYRGVNNEKT